METLPSNIADLDSLESFVLTANASELAEVDTLITGIPTDILHPSDFRAQLLIDAGGTLKPLESCLDPWQREDYEAADQGWLRMVTGQGDGLLRYYFERPKGHDKTTGEAHMAGWALHVAQRPLEGLAAAGSMDQAYKLAAAMDGMVRRNPWLSETISVHNREVVNKKTGSHLDILTSDEATNQGANPDFIIGDEVTVWKNAKLWDMLLTSSGKKKNCMFVVIANAGFGKGVSWQWQKMDYARRHPEEWHFHSLPGPCASWIDSKEIEKQREQVVFGSEFQRVWLNEWVEEGGETISASDVRECTVWPCPMVGFDDSYEPFIAGLDLAATRHHAALVVLGVHSGTGKVRVAHVESWKPQDYPDRQIPFEVVHAAISEARRRFKLFQLCLDPTEGRYMMQLLAKEVSEDPTQAMRIVPLKGAMANHEMAVALVDALNNRRIELFEHKELRDDLLKLKVVKKTYGFGIDAPEDVNSGHCDRAIALGIALPAALAMASELHVTPVNSLPLAPVVPVPAANGYHAPGARRWSSL
jgi:hypothetical protein